jgi:hypothetical protein
MEYLATLASKFCNDVISRSSFNYYLKSREYTSFITGFHHVSVIQEGVFASAIVVVWPGVAVCVVALDASWKAAYIRFILAVATASLL